MKLYSVPAKVQPRDPKPPRHLRPATRRWWASVVAQYELESHHLRLLTLAGEAWDRGEAAREEVQRHGSAYFADRLGNIKQHPALATQKEASITFARMLRELCLDVEAPGPVGRPPSLGHVPASRRS